MSQSQAFIDQMTDRYSHKGESILLGKAKLEDKVIPEATISLPLKTLNRHGIISGATGTGKTKTVQLLLEGLSEHGIPSLVMDMKGDLSGLAQAGDETNKHIIKRHTALQIPYKAMGLPVELLSLDTQAGVRLRATVSEFGPLLLSKILGLNTTQESVMGVIFHYCDQKQLGLVDLEDLKTVLNYIGSEGKDDFSQNYGFVSPASIGTIFRKIIALEQQGGADFFGEPSFDIYDLIRTKDAGKGVINIVRLMDMQDKPALFSTFMLSMLAEIYDTLPEAGDTEKPLLALVIDEAHLVFKEATQELLAELETIVKLIRSKGVGIFFCTQLPDDIPASVLSQLGLKIQHQLRGVTQRDRKAILQAVQNYPMSDFYTTDSLIMELGIGEAFVTCLDEKGIPTPLAHTYLRAPQTRMDILTPIEVKELTDNSLLVSKYQRTLERESAHEMLQKSIAQHIESEGGKVSDISSGSGISGLLSHKFVKGVASDMANQIIRGTLRKLGLKVHGSRSFIKF